MSCTRATQFPPAVVVGLALVASAVLATPVVAQTWESIPANPRVEIEYLAPTSARFENVYESLQQRKILEELQHFLAPLHLPHPLRLLAKQCGVVNAFYNPSSRSLTICYELVAEIVDSAPQTVSEDGFVTREAAIVGNLIGVLLHEGGHMLFDMLDVPVFGREEDAADETASFMALQFNKDVARTIVKGFVYFWAREQDPAASAPMGVWSDEHGKRQPAHVQRVVPGLWRRSADVSGVHRSGLVAEKKGRPLRPGVRPTEARVREHCVALHRSGPDGARAADPVAYRRRAKVNSAAANR